MNLGGEQNAAIVALVEINVYWKNKICIAGMNLP